MKDSKLIAWLFYLSIQIFLIITIYIGLNFGLISLYRIFEMIKESFFVFLGKKLLFGFILSSVSAFIMTILWRILKNKLELQEYSFMRIYIIQWLLFFLCALISVGIYLQHIYSTSPVDRLP